MIRRRLGMYQLLTDIVPRLDVAHTDLTRIVAALRNVNVVVMTILPDPVPADGVVRYSAFGWRQHFAAERASFVAFGAAADTLAARQQFPDVAAALVDYMEAMPRLVAGLDLLLARYPNATTVPQVVTQAHRTALANAIDAELAA